VFGTLVLSTDHADSKVCGALAKGAGRDRRCPGFHPPPELPEALRVGAPPFGYREVASNVVTPLALVLGPDAVRQALVLIEKGGQKRERGFLPIVLAEQLGVSAERAERAINGHASAHLVLWAGDPAVVRQDIVPGAPVAPSWLGPEDRALFAADRTHVFDESMAGWAEPGGAGGDDPETGAPGRAGAADGSAAADGSKDTPTAAGGSPAGSGAGTPTAAAASPPVSKRSPSPMDASAAAGGPSAGRAASSPEQSPLRVDTSSASPVHAHQPPTRGEGSSLLPATWRQILSPAVRHHPAVRAFLGTQDELRRTAAAGLARRLVPRRDFASDLLAPGGPLHRLPQPWDAEGLPGLPMAAPRPSGGGLRRPLALEASPSSPSSSPALSATASAGGPVTLAAPHRHHSEWHFAGPLAVAVSEALASKRAAEQLERSNSASDGFDVLSDSADVAAMRAAGRSEQDDVDDEPEAAEHDDDGAGRGDCAREGMCLPGGAVPSLDGAGDGSSKGSDAGLARSSLLSSAPVPPVGRSELRCHISRLPRDGAVPGLLSPMAAEVHFRTPTAAKPREAASCGVFGARGGDDGGERERSDRPSPQALRRLLYTLAGVPPMHVSSGMVYPGFGSDTELKGRAFVHLYPNLALASLPAHLTWVVPAGTVTDQAGAQEYAQKRVPKGEGALLRSMHAGDGVNIMDELCIFLCGGGRSRQAEPDDE